MDSSKIKTLRKQVEFILSVEPQSRNSDIDLTIRVWRRFYPKELARADGRVYIRLQNLFNVPNQDNIKRVRAKLNAEGLYLPTDPKVAAKRGINEKVWRESMAKAGHHQAKLL